VLGKRFHSIVKMLSAVSAFAQAFILFPTVVFGCIFLYGYVINASLSKLKSRQEVFASLFQIWDIFLLLAFSGGYMVQYYYFPHAFELRFNLVKVIIASMLVDLAITYLHYSYHKSRTLYTFFHSRHHKIKSSQIYSVLGLNADVSEIITYLTVFYGFQVVFKFSLAEFVLYASVYIFHIFIAHEAIEVKYINCVFVDGITHLQHHHYPNKNFGIMYTIWDKYVLDTWVSPYDGDKPRSYPQGD